MKSEIRHIFGRILKDIQVEMSDEFDQNFEREAFFSEAWQRRKSPLRPGRHILVDTGKLRNSIRSRTTENSITFFTTEPYAAIHNEGGEIVVTQRMKKYFRHKFYESQGGFQRKQISDVSRRPLSDGGFYAWTSKMQLTPEAEFWRFMALKKAGTTIKIPRRRFLGTSPEVEQAVRTIIEENLNGYIEEVINFTIR